jgi:hypothetical protein
MNRVDVDGTQKGQLNASDVIKAIYLSERILWLRGALDLQRQISYNIQGLSGTPSREKWIRN